MTHAAKIRAALIGGAVLVAFGISAVSGTIWERAWTTGDTDSHVTPFDAKCEKIVRNYLGPKEQGHLSYDAYVNLVNDLGECSKRKH